MGGEGKSSAEQFSVAQVSRLRKAGPRRSTRFSCYSGKSYGDVCARSTAGGKCREEKRFSFEPFVFTGISTAAAKNRPK